MVGRNGSEVQYEVTSPLITVVARGPLRVSPELGINWTPRVGWELRCGVSQNPSLLWNLTACRTTPQDANFTLCHCPSLGTYAALLVKAVNLVSTMCLLLVFFQPKQNPFTKDETVNKTSTS